MFCLYVWKCSIYVVHIVKNILQQRAVKKNLCKAFSKSAVIPCVTEIIEYYYIK